jgi:hypothetical protein
MEKIRQPFVKEMCQSTADFGRVRPKRAFQDVRGCVSGTEKPFVAGELPDAVSFDFPMRERLDGFLARRGALVLMWLLIILTLIGPVADSYPHVGAGMALLIVASVIAGARLPANRRVVVRLVFPVSSLWIVVRLLEAFGNRPQFYSLIAHCVGLLLSCAILWGILGRLGSSQVKSGILAEAFICYLVIAIAYSQLYWLLSGFFADSFNETLPRAESAEYMYFSMITLSGVGYGKIAPVNPYVRMIAAFESMTGIFYIAVVVSRLVSSYRSQRDVPKFPGEERLSP